MNDIKWYYYIRDIIIYSAIIIALVIIGIYFFRDVSEKNILDKVVQYIGSFVTILFGAIGVIEFAYDSGLFALVPTTFERYKKKKLKEQTKLYLNDFFIREAEFFSLHSNNRITYLLNQLGLSYNQLDQLKMAILSVKLMPLKNIDDAKDKLKEIIKSANIILSQDKMISDDLIYKQVKYFINLTDVMFIDDYRSEITDCLAYLICEISNKEKINYTRIAISHSGNFLLGTSVSEKLTTALIRVTKQPLILNSKSWIGNFSDNSVDTTIFVHDVLVTGDQIIESVKKIEKKTKVVAIFCLISRLDFNGKNEISDKLGIPVYSLLELDDEKIKEMQR